MDGRKEKVDFLGERNDSNSSLGEKLMIDAEKMVDRLRKNDERTLSGSSLKSVEDTLPSYFEEKGKEYADVGGYKGVFTNSSGERIGAFKNKEKVDVEKKYQEKMKQAEKNAIMLRKNIKK